MKLNKRTITTLYVCACARALDVYTPTDDFQNFNLYNLKTGWKSNFQILHQRRFDKSIGRLSPLA